MIFVCSSIKLIFCGRLVGNYFANQATSTKISVAMGPKVVTAWRVVPVSCFLHFGKTKVTSKQENLD